MQKTVSISIENNITANETRQFCTFWMAGRLFGVDILDVKEINDDIKLTKIFHASEAVKGYMNIRGQIHLVIDLRLLLGFERKKLDSDNRVVIFKPAVDEPFGVLVDKIDDVVEVEKNQIEERRKNEEYSDATRRAADEELTSGVCKLKDNLLIVLNARSILKITQAAGMKAA